MKDEDQEEANSKYRLRRAIIRTYTDEEGHKVTVYKTAYADGSITVTWGALIIAMD